MHNITPAWPALGELHNRRANVILYYGADVSYTWVADLPGDTFTDDQARRNNVTLSTVSLDAEYREKISGNSHKAHHQAVIGVAEPEIAAASAGGIVVPASKFGSDVQSSKQFLPGPSVAILRDSDATVET
jgi:L-lactate utilization protein LutC